MTLATTIDPKLAPLAFNGGRTKTHALLFDSLALDSGNNAYATTLDQRGEDRVVDINWDLDSLATVDIGAVEMAFDEYVT